MKTDNEQPNGTPPAKPEGEAFLTKEVVAERLCVTPRTVARWARTGRLPAHRFGRSVRFKWSEVVAAPRADGPRAGVATNGGPR
jgi:excisionase family DNA binding protein